MSSPHTIRAQGWSGRSAFGTRQQAVRAVLVVLLTTAIGGGLTAPAQEYLSAQLGSLANASGTWLAVVMGSILVARPRLVLAIILGIVGFVVMNESYGLVSRWRGYPYAGGLSSVWNRLAFGVGPVVGVASTWLRSSRPVLVALGAAAPAAVFVGEGLYGLTVIAATTSPVFWTIELVAGVIVVVLAVVLRLRRVGAASVLLAATGVGAALFYLAYSSL